ncbi:MAG: phytoene desaturase family protein [Blastocatellia bacterium]|jgi:phytoene desaturase
MNRNKEPREVTIVGGGLGGLSAGIHLRLAGYEVTIYEANEQVGGRANQLKMDGFTFDTGPSLLNYPWVFEDLFKAAGRKFSDYVETIAVDPSVTFQWRDGTVFRLSSNLQSLMSECERIEPGSRPNLLAFLHDTSIKYRMSFDKLVTRNEDNPLKWFSALTPDEMSRLSIWRSLDGELGRFFKKRYIREAFGSYGMYLGGSPYDLPGLFTILSYGELAYGLWLPKGGIYGLVSGIEKLALELGVTIRTSAPVARIMIGNSGKGGGRQVTGIELQDGQVIPSRLVVSNVDVPTTERSLISQSDGPGRKLPRAPRMTPGVMTFYWGVKGKVAGIGHHTIFLPEDFRLGFTELLKEKVVPRDMPFYISVPSETDPDLAPSGDTAMFVLVPTPLLSELPNLDSPELVEQVRQRVLDRLRDDGIDLDPARIVSEKVYTPEDWRKMFGLYDGSAFGAAHTLFQVGPFRARNYARDVEGLFYVGASTTPGTGMPMVVLGGKLTAERIESRVQ